MTDKEFRRVLQDEHTDMNTSLAFKQKQYGTDDRLWNFKAIGEVRNRTPMQVCMDLVSKHFTSLCREVDAMAKGESLHPALMRELTRDIRNYCGPLMMALFKEAEREVAHHKEAEREVAHHALTGE